LSFIKINIFELSPYQKNLFLLKLFWRLVKLDRFNFLSQCALLRTNVSEKDYYLKAYECRWVLCPEPCLISRIFWGNLIQKNKKHGGCFRRNWWNFRNWTVEDIVWGAFCWAEIEDNIFNDLIERKSTQKIYKFSALLEVD